jgi:hypothetical protein
MKRDDLKEIYERYYKGQRRSNHARILWTNEDDEKLQKIINDEIEQVEETANYGRALEYQKEYLSKKLNLSQPTATGILCDYLAKTSCFSRIEISKYFLIHWMKMKREPFLSQLILLLWISIIFYMEKMMILL